MERFKVAATPTALAVCLALSLYGCSQHDSVARAAWREVPATALASDGSFALEETVSAGGDGRPALIGGVIVGVSASGGFFPTSSRRIGLWVAPTIGGPWRLASMNADPGRDGPNETVMYLADNATSAAAFGWRNSPTEGYPRPSPWIASDHTDGAWDEILEPREFFGGPNIVAFGGMSGGPHGYFVAGTWTTSPGHSGVSVWRSTDGRTWIHDTAEPDLQGDSVRFSFGEGVADGVRGVMLLGNVEVPTRADPGAQAGVMWFSPDGGHWTRLSDIGSPQRTYDAAWATDAGWVIAGTVGSSQARRPAEWFVPADRRVTAPVLLPGDLSAGPVRITSISGDRRTLVIAGHAGSRPLLWAARLSNGVPRSWRVLAPPPRSPVGLDRVTVSCGPDGTIISLTGNAYSQVWTTTWH